MKLSCFAQIDVSDIQFVGYEYMLSVLIVSFQKMIWLKDKGKIKIWAP